MVEPEQADVQCPWCDDTGWRMRLGPRGFFGERQCDRCDYWVKRAEARRVEAGRE